MPDGADDDEKALAAPFTEALIAYHACSHVSFLLRKKNLRFAGGNTAYELLRASDTLGHFLGWQHRQSPGIRRLHLVAFLWHVAKARGPLHWRTNRYANLLDALVYVVSCAHQPTPWAASALAFYIPMRALSWVW